MRKPRGWAAGPWSPAVPHWASADAAYRPSPAGADRLPAGDHASRAIVAQMKEDEAAHAAHALDAGGIELPPPVKGLMRVAAKVMTTTAHYV